MGIDLLDIPSYDRGENIRLGLRWCSLCHTPCYQFSSVKLERLGKHQIVFLDSI